MLFIWACVYGRAALHAVRLSINPTQAIAEDDALYSGWATGPYMICELHPVMSVHVLTSMTMTSCSAFDQVDVTTHKLEHAVSDLT